MFIKKEILQKCENRSKNYEEKDNHTMLEWMCNYDK